MYKNVSGVLIFVRYCVCVINTTTNRQKVSVPNRRIRSKALICLSFFIMKINQMLCC